MRKYLSLIAVAALMTGCQSDDVTSMEPINSYDAIAFSVDETDFGTRAAGEIPNTDALKDAASTGFGVFASYTGVLKYDYTSVKPDFMYNQQVKYKAGSPDGAWIYNPLKYWPNEETDHITFFAYAPYEGSPSGSKCIAEFSAPNEQGDPWLVYKMSQKINDQVDLMFGVNAATDAPWYDQTKAQFTTEGKLSFTFKHALACAGDTVSIQATQELIDYLAGYAEIYIDSIVIEYQNLTSKARLTLNSNSTPNWSAIVSGDLAVTRTVNLKEDAQFLLTSTKKKFEGVGVFYIPFKVAADDPKAFITVYYTVKNMANETYSGSASNSFLLDMSNNAVGKKNTINLAISKDLDLLHLTYDINGDPATEPSYSKKF